MVNSGVPDYVAKVHAARQAVKEQRELAQKELNGARNQHQLAEENLKSAVEAVKQDVIDWNSDADVAVIAKHKVEGLALPQNVYSPYHARDTDLWMTHRKIWFLRVITDEKGYDVFRYESIDITKETRATAIFVGGETIKTGNMIPLRDVNGRIVEYSPETKVTETGRRVTVSWDSETYVYRTYYSYDHMKNIDAFIDAVNSQWEKIVAHDNGPSDDERIADAEFRALQQMEAAEKRLAEAEEKRSLKQAEAELEKLLSEASEDERGQLAAHEADLEREKRKQTIIILTVAIVLAVMLLGIGFFSTLLS